MLGRRTAAYPLRDYVDNPRKEKEMDKKMIVLFFKAIGAIGGIAGFVWLFMYDWKLAIAVYFILWGNNVSTKNT